MMDLLEILLTSSELEFSYNKLGPDVTIDRINEICKLLRSNTTVRVISIIRRDEIIIDSSELFWSISVDTLETNRTINGLCISSDGIRRNPE